MWLHCFRRLHQQYALISRTDAEADTTIENSRQKQNTIDLDTHAVCSGYVIVCNSMRRPNYQIAFYFWYVPDIEYDWNRCKFRAAPLHSCDNVQYWIQLPGNTNYHLSHIGHKASINLHNSYLKIEGKDSFNCF